MVVRSRRTPHAWSPIFDRAVGLMYHLALGHPISVPLIIERWCVSRATAKRDLSRLKRLLRLKRESAGWSWPSAARWKR